MYPHGQGERYGNQSPADGEDMKKLVCAGEILVEIMAERIGQSFRAPG
ncbi:MAG: sugar kinase, partial [Mesorhizobium sp.]